MPAVDITPREIEYLLHYLEEPLDKTTPECDKEAALRLSLYNKLQESQNANKTS